MQDELRIVDLPKGERSSVEPILEQSFEGLYLWHSRRTLRNIEVVKSLLVNGKNVGVSMLEELDRRIGYVYYIAISPEFRGRGFGGVLLDHSINYFSAQGIKEIYASVEADNKESLLLFRSRHFRETGFGELSRKYGRIKAAKLYAKMLVVRGETLLYREPNQKLQ
jgi:ribosomal protein S18 acetylase RimI-like enzyme